MIRGGTDRPAPGTDPVDLVSPPGLDLDAFRAWAEDNVTLRPDALAATLIAGGKSNLTFVVSDGTSEWILRRPPLGHVLESAHDMGREYRVLSALHGTAVPVPLPYAICLDSAILGAPFYLMERCQGTPYRRAHELEPLGPERTQVISQRLVDTLVALHAIEPGAVGLGDLGRPAGFLDRQVRRWKRQLDASDATHLALASELHQMLSRGVPKHSDASIIHGDYRLDNVLVDEADRLTAVLDWEMATLGDPLTDLALMLVYLRLGADRVPGLSDVSAAPGFADERSTIERYTLGSERDVSDIGFHLGLAAFKLAVILEGIDVRHRRGQTVGGGFDGIGDAIEPLLIVGIDAVRGNG